MSDDNKLIPYNPAEGFPDDQPRYETQQAHLFAEGKRRCGRCTKILPVIKFGMYRSGPQGLSYVCKPCARERNQEYRKNHPEVVERDRERSREYQRAKDPKLRRERMLRKNYEMTLDDYDALLREQGGVCAICVEKPSRRLDVDHDHATGRVRGLLCNACNTGLGLLRDSIENLQNAEKYLRKQTCYQLEK